MKKLYSSTSEKTRAYRLRNLEKVRVREKAWDEKNREKRNAISAAWRARNRRKWLESSRASYERNKEKSQSRTRDWKERNKERNAASELAYREKNREKVLATYKDYRERHPERSLHDGAVRRSRIKKGKIAKITAAQLRDRLSMFGGMCWMCGEKADQVDHVIPLSGGGLHVLANLRPACGRCNRKKGKRRIAATTG
jgi:5-methylcytosine-specific restriction endonuclease McrA